MDSPLAIAAVAVSALVVVFLVARFVPWFLAFLRFWGRSTRHRLLALLLVASAVLAVTFSRTSRLELRFASAEMRRAEVAETAFLPPPGVLAALSLGHETFVADVLFLRANLYFVSHLFGDRIFHWLDTYLGTLLALDPENPRVYEWASQAVKFGQLITPEVLERSNDYARRGIERFPDHWRFYFDIGFNYLIEWRPKSEEEREELRKKALPWFSIAAQLPGSQLDPNFLAELYAQEADVEMALFHAYLRYFESSEREREALRGRITRYESEAAAERLARIEARWKETRPYVPIGLFELIGPPHEVRVPRSWARTPTVSEEG